MDTKTETDTTTGDSSAVLPARESLGLGIHALWLGLFLAAFAPTNPVAVADVDSQHLG